MRKTDYSRKLDALGRLVLPSPLREQLNIECGVPYDFYIYECQHFSPQFKWTILEVF